MLPKSAFDEIQKEIERKSIEMNKYRLASGDGKSQTFGLVNRRCLPPDYSRQCWLRPYLYKLLLDFGEKYVKPRGIDFNSITVNQCYAAAKHKDKHNGGESFLVAFGDYTGGELKIYEGDLSGNHIVNQIPIITDFSKVYHSVEPFTGKRYSLVYYKMTSNRPLPEEQPSVRFQDGTWCFFRGDVLCKGLAHPLKGRRKTQMKVEEGEFTVSFD